MAGYTLSSFRSAVRAKAARCKLPYLFSSYVHSTCRIVRLLNCPQDLPQYAHTRTYVRGWPSVGGGSADVAQTRLGVCG